jgi:hypothetical protein
MLSINGDSYRMRAHRDAISSLRPAITGGKSRDHPRRIRSILDTGPRTLAVAIDLAAGRPAGVASHR